MVFIVTTPQRFAYSTGLHHGDLTYFSYSGRVMDLIVNDTCIMKTIEILDKPQMGMAVISKIWLCQSSLLLLYEEFYMVLIRKRSCFGLYLHKRQEFQVSEIIN